MGNIYILVDPITEEIRYVGATTHSLKKRLYQHLHPSCPSRAREWIKALQSRGLVPRIHLVEKSPDDALMSKEAFWIRFYLKAGVPLLNVESTWPDLENLEKPRVIQMLLEPEVWRGIAKEADRMQIGVKQTAQLAISEWLEQRRLNEQVDSARLSS